MAWAAMLKVVDASAFTLPCEPDPLLTENDDPRCIGGGGANGGGACCAEACSGAPQLPQNRTSARLPAWHRGQLTEAGVDCGAVTVVLLRCVE